MTWLPTYHRQHEGGHGGPQIQQPVGEKTFLIPSIQERRFTSHYSTVKLPNIHCKLYDHKHIIQFAIRGLMNSAQSTYINDHLIYLTNVNMLHWVMAGNFPENSPITSANNQNLYNAILPIKIVSKLEEKTKFPNKRWDWCRIKLFWRTNGFWRWDWTKRKMRYHFLVRTFIFLCQLNNAIKYKDFPVWCRL